MRPWTNKSLGLGLFGFLLIVSGTTLYFSWPAIFHHILQKELPLTPTSKAFQVWNDTSSLPPMYLKIHFFNWTNPEELLIKGKKPNLVEVGPYVFREIRQKADVVFHPENDTVSYLYQRWWFFEPELTNGSLNDSITQLNAVAISAKHKVRYWDGALQSTLSFMLTASKVHTTKTVNELLFAGYDDSLIKLGRMAALGDEIPPFDKFGWFYMRNGSTMFDGHYNMDTGVHDISEFGVLKKWNHKDTTKFFKSPCNLVEGSAGEFWPPYRHKDEISLFSGDLCRPLTFDYAQTTYHMGMEGYQYVLSEKTLGNNTRRRYPHDQAKYFEQTTTTEDFFEVEHSAEITDPPEQDPDIVNIGNCFCNGRCTPAGLMNVTACRYGAPVFASLPHFNRADPSLTERITGIDPQDDHDFYIILEPATGIPLKVSAKLQINILLEPSKTVSLFRSVPTIYFPVMWFSLEVEATQKFVDDLKKLLSLPNVCIYAGIILILVGSLIIFTVALLYLLNRQRANSVASDKITKPEVIASRDKTELVYLDNGKSNEDPHVRSDRKLYPSAQSKLQNEK
ncbi:protein croquemort-like [Osmia bicornis bicornis]|uniref:protein croquemort-like n=1 Tax=Osmia bicornis bicornis TaxID=1437191 RepID=UPI0010F9CE6A|nr:protein croquemort-like [Osmia bicornis bicornis]XP_029042885.1 protein croquemort-like [Osmia bicornis bicornis]